MSKTRQGSGDANGAPDPANGTPPVGEGPRAEKPRRRARQANGASEAPPAPPAPPPEPPPDTARLSAALDQLDRTRRRGRRVRAFLFLLLLAVTASAGVRTYLIYHGVSQNLEKYQVAFLDEMLQLLPGLGEELFKVGVHVFPALRAAIVNDVQQNKDDILKTLRQELNNFIRDVVKYFLQGMAANLQKAILGEQSRLEDAFPPLRDPAAREAVLAALDRSVAKASGQALEAHLHEQMLAGVNARAAPAFACAPRPAPPGAPRPADERGQP